MTSRDRANGPVCDDCKGTGKVTHGPLTETCEKCDGEGRLKTDVSWNWNPTIVTRDGEEIKRGADSEYHNKHKQRTAGKDYHVSRYGDVGDDARRKINMANRGKVVVGDTPITTGEADTATAEFLAEAAGYDPDDYALFWEGLLPTDVKMPNYGPHPWEDGHEPLTGDVDLTEPELTIIRPYPLPEDERGGPRSAGHQQPDNPVDK